MKRMSIGIVVLIMLTFMMSMCVVTGSGSVTLSWHLQTGTINATVEDSAGAALPSVATVTVYEAVYSSGVWLIGSEYTGPEDIDEGDASVTYNYSATLDGKTLTVDDIEWGEYYIVITAEGYVDQAIFIDTGVQSDTFTTTVNDTVEVASSTEIGGLRIEATWDSGDFDMYFSFPATDQNANIDSYASAYYPDPYYGGAATPAVATADDDSCAYGAAGDGGNDYYRGVLGGGTAGQFTTDYDGDGDCTDTTDNGAIVSIKYTGGSDSEVLDIYEIPCDSEWFATTHPDMEEYYMGAGLLTLHKKTSSAAELSEGNVTVTVYNGKGLLSVFTAPVLMQEDEELDFTNWRVMEVDFFGRYETAKAGAEWQTYVDLNPYNMDNYESWRTAEDYDYTVNLGGRSAR